MAELSVKLANASQQDTATTSDQITALMNAYNLSGNIKDLSKALDSWALVANISAADVEELAKASQKAASSASTVGVSLDQMNAQIATIESVTRDAPEQIGNGLKTLYSRLSDIKLGETLEDGVGLGQVTSTLESIGVKVLDQMGSMRNVGDIIEDLMVVWDDLDQTAKEAAGQAIAGKYQLNRFYALMDNSDMYQQYKEGSENAEGTLNQMNEEVVNSLQGKMNKLQATWEDLFNSLFDTDNVYPFIDAATAALDVIDEIVDSIGGGIPVLTGLLAVFTKMFSSNIAQQITDYEFNRNLTNTKIANTEAAPELLNYFSSANPDFLPNQEEMVKQLSLLKENSKNLSQEQLNLASQEVDTLLQNTKELVMANENLEKTATTMRTSLGSIFSDSDIVFKDEGGKWDFFNAEALFGEIQNNTESAKNFGKAIKETQNTISGMIGDVGKVESNFRSLEKALNQGKTETEQFDTIWNNTNDTLQKLINNTEDFRSVLNPDKVDSFVETLKILQEELGTNADQFIWDKEKVVEFLKELFEVKNALTDVQSGGLQKLEQVLNHSERQRTQVNFAERKQETSVKNIGAINEGAENTAQKKQIIEVTSALGELAFSWQAFQNLGSLWFNKDLKLGEKLLQTIMNLSMVLPNLISSFKTLQGMQGIKTLFNVGKTAVTDLVDKINPLKKVDQWQQELHDSRQNLMDMTIDSYDRELEEKRKKIEELERKKIELQNRIKNLQDDNINIDAEVQDIDKKMPALDNRAKPALGSKRRQLLNQKIANTAEITKNSHEIKELNKNIENAETSFSEAAESGARFIKNTEVPANTLTGFERLKQGISNVGESFTALFATNAPFLIISGLVTALSAIQSHLESVREAANEAFDAANTKYSEISSQIDNFNELYKTWKETGEGADQLAESGTALSETLKIAGGEALAASEDFDKLKDRINSATEAQRAYQDVISTAQGAVSQNERHGFLNIQTTTGDIGDVLSTTTGGYGRLDLALTSVSPQLEYAKRNFEGAFKNSAQRKVEADLQTSFTNNDINGDIGFWMDPDNTAEAIGKLAQAMDIIKEKQKEYQVGSEEFNALQEKWNALNTVYVSEQVQNTRIQIQAMAEATTKTIEFNDKLKEAGTDIEKIKQIFAEDPGTAQFFEMTKSEAEKLDFILKNIQTDSQEVKDKLQVAQLETSLQEQDSSLNFSALDGMSDQFKIKVLAELDPNSHTSLQEQLNELVKDENILKIQMQLETDEVREKYKDVWQAMLEDETVGAAQLSDVFDENMNKILTDVSGLSSAFNDAFTLMTDGSYESQAGMAQLASTLNDVEHNMEFSSIEDGVEKLEELESTAKSLENIDPKDWKLADINLEDIEEAKDEVNELADTLEDRSFKLSVDIGGDLIDQADALTEALGDVSDGIGMIGEDFLVAADDVKALEDAFPGILEGYTVTADGMIQLNAAVAQSAIGTATTDAESFSQAQVSKLLNYADYADQMSQRYMEEAVEMANNAQNQVSIETDVDTDIANSEKELLDYNIGLMNEKDLALSNAAKNEILYGQQAGGEVGNAMEQGADHAAKALSSLSYESKNAAQAVLEQWVQVAEQVKASGEGNVEHTDIRGGYDTAGITPSGPVVVNDKVQQYEKIFIGDSNKPFNVRSDEKNQKYAQKAVEYQHKAEMYQRIAGQSRASAAQLQATQAKVTQDIQDVGLPEKLKEEKAPKESTPKEPKEETPKEEKVYDPKIAEYIEEEVDLYEKVNTQLDDVQAELSRIEKETDRLIGPKARANMNNQIKLLEKEINLQREKLSIQEQERANLGAQLADRFGIWFDEEGFIDNYADILTSLEDEVNQLTDAYNNEATEEGQERLSNEIDAAKENLEQFKELYQRYDQLQGKEIQDTINQIEELKDGIEDLRVEAYKASQEALDDLKELRDNAAELLGLFSEYESDSPFRATIVDAEKLKNIFGGTREEAIEYYQTIIDKNRELMLSATDPEEIATYQSYIHFLQDQQVDAANNPLGTGALGLASSDLARLQYWRDNPWVEDNPFMENTAALDEAYRDAYDRMRELALESEEVWEQLRDDIIDGYDEIAEKEEEQIGRYDRITEQLENIADVNALVYGDDAYNDMRKLYDQIGRTTMQQAQDQKVIYQQWVERYNSIEDKTSDIAKAVREHMEEAEDRLIELQKNVIEAWQKAFENAMKEITARQNKAILGVRNVDDISTDWERDRSYADKYYDEVQKANLIEQLRLKYMNLLDDAQGSSLAIQRKIRDSMNEQVKYLEDQNHLSEFNVKYANAQLEILQKQIALEDARNNKNQMRLRRDTQGNYRYVYSANEDDVRNKEADLLQSEFDAYNMSTENRMNTYSDWLNAYQNYIQQRESLIQRIEQGDQEAAAALKKLEEDFARDMAAYSEELGDSWEGMVGSLQWMTETGTDAIREMAENALTAIKEKSDESLQAVGIQWNGTVDGAIENIGRLLTESSAATAQLQAEAISYYNMITDEATGAASLLNGTSMEMVGNFTDIDGAIQNASVSTRDLAEASWELQQALMGDNAQLVEASKQLEAYRQQLDDVKNSSAVTAQQLLKTQQELDQATVEKQNYRTILDDIAAGRRNRDGSWYVPEPTPAPSEPMAPEPEPEPEPPSEPPAPDPGRLERFRVEEVYDMINRGEASVAPARRGIIVSRGYSEREARAGQELINLSYPTWANGEGWDYYAALDYIIDNFDTGGYTGKWSGKDGKLAMLHQKELILNESDTENILSAVDMVRSMTDAFKMFNNISVKGTGFNKIGGDTIEQRVEIRAEFPNVQDSNEIQNALLSIADSAYQYSYRER